MNLFSVHIRFAPISDHSQSVHKPIFYCLKYLRAFLRLGRGIVLAANPVGVIGHGHLGLAAAAGTHDVKNGEDHCDNESNPVTPQYQSSVPTLINCAPQILELTRRSHQRRFHQP